MNKVFVFAVFLLVGRSFAFSQDILKFNIQGKKSNIDLPVSVSLDGVDYNTDKFALVLYESTKDGEKRVPSQIETGHSARLWFILKGNPSLESTRKFIVRKEEMRDFGKYAVTIENGIADLILKLNNRSVLDYRCGLTYPPDSVTPVFSKKMGNLIKYGAYIHPLWSPGGEVLTQIHPYDHPHHYGIWGSWTKTHIGQRALNFWDLSLGQGTVRYAGLLSLDEGDVFGGFRALQEHMDYGANGPDQVALNELFDVRVWNSGPSVYMVDYTTTLTTAIDSNLVFEKYRYGGGLGFRSTAKWNAKTSTILTSESKTRANADSTTARWCIVEGVSGTKDGRSGILFMSHPANRMHPEPMRVWPESFNDLYFQFSPIKFESWRLQKNKAYTLKYRMIIFDGKLSAAEAEKYWMGFAQMPVVEIVR